MHAKELIRLGKYVHLAAAIVHWAGTFVNTDPGANGCRSSRKKGAGARMIEEMRKQGKPVDARMLKLADWMDGMEDQADVCVDG